MLRHAAKWIGSHLRVFLELGFGLIVVGIVTTPFRSLDVISSVFGATGMFLFAAVMLVHGLVRSIPIAFAVAAAALVGGCLVLIPADARPRGVLIVPALLIVVLVLVGRRRLLG
jgi:hypothetical protein